jgi:Protein  of unknown function (DUF3018)
MAPPSQRKRSAERTRRTRMRRRGLRPLEIWVPDPSAPRVVEEAHRQSLAVATSPHEKDDQDFVDAVFGLE